MSNLFEELKRRNVVRVGIAYLIMGWVIMQIVDVLAQTLVLPEWFGRAVLVLLLVGLPLALFFSWAFELTSEGLKKTEEVDADASITPSTGRKLDRVIIAALVLALGYFVWDKFGAEPPAQIGEVLVAAESDGLLSIAVLPFVNMSSDAEQEYFSDGISEELLNVLAKIEGLKVAARTSSFSFKGQNKPIGEIAEVLGVGHILEGSVRKAGSQIRITAQLIRVSDGFHMWSETYDRELVNIFAIQDEIAAAIVAGLQVELTGQQKAQLTTSTTDNAEAYQEFLKGRYFWNLRAVENLYLAVEHFERATELDPAYAEAWAGLAQTWVLLPVWEFDDAKAPDQFLRAQETADKALAINPRSGGANTALAFMHQLKWEWSEALAKHKLAIAHQPNQSTSWHWYSSGLSTLGRHDEAIAASRKALELDPLSRIAGTSLAETLLAAGQYDAALDRINKTIALAPDFGFAWEVKGFIHLVRYEFDEARAAFPKTQWNEIAAIASEVIDRVEAFVIDNEMGELPVAIYDSQKFDHYYTALALVCAGQYGLALDFIEQRSNADLRLPAARFVASSLFHEKMGDIPRYQELVERLATVKEGSN